METEPTRKKKSWKRRFLIGLTLLLVGTAVLVVLLPWGIRWGLQRALRDNGHPTVVVQDVDFNLFTGRLVVYALDARSAEEKQIALGETRLRIEWWPLLHQQFVIEDIVIRDVTIDITQTEDGEIVLGGLSLPGGDESDSEPGFFSRWGVGTGNIDLENVTVRLAIPHLQTAMTIYAAHVDPMRSWIPDEASAFHLKANLDTATLGAEGEIKPFLFAPWVDGRVTLKDAPLALLAPFLKHAGIASLAGSLAFDLRATGSIEPESQTLAFDLEGTTSLHDFQLDYAAGEIRQAEFMLDGGLRLAGGLVSPAISLNGTISGTDGRVFLPEQGLTMTLEGLGVSGKGDIHLDGEEPMRLDGGIDLTGLSLKDGLGNSFSVATLGIKSGTLAAPLDFARADLKGKIGVEALHGVIVGDSPSQMDIASLGLSGEGAYVAEGTTLDLKGALESAGLQFRSGKDELALAAFQLRDLTAKLAMPEAGGKLDLTTALLADGISGALMLKGPRDWRPLISGDDVVPESRPMALQLASMELDDLTISFAFAEGANTKLTLSSVLSLGALNADIQAYGVTVGQEEFSASIAGDLDLGEPLEGILKSSFSSSALVITDQRTDGALLRIEKSEITDFSLDLAGTMGLKELQMAQVQFLEQKGDNVGDAPFAVSLGNLETKKLSAQTTSASIGTIALEDLQGFLGIQTDGSLELAPYLPEPKEGKEAEASVSKDEISPFAVQLGELTIDGESSFRFVDRSMAMPVSLDVAPFTFRLGVVDSAHPTASTPLKFDAQSGDYTRLDVTGTVAPLDSGGTFDLTAKLEGLSLPTFSPYTERKMGYRLKSGLLGAEASMKATQGQLDSVLDLVLNKFALERLSAEEKDELTEQLGVPVNTALSLLRDKEDAIKLTIPITGDLADPDLSMGDAVRQATLGAVRKSAMAVVAPLGAASLFPPLGAAMLVGKLAKKAGKTGFESVVFEPGAEVLSEEARTYLDKLGDVLGKRPGITLTFCARLSAADQQALAPKELFPLEEEEFRQTGAPLPQVVLETDTPSERQTNLIALGTAREEAMKAYLVTQHDIAPERIFLCTPVVDESSESVGRVEVTF
ncbi:MAG: DUF748 domain-containing protein [Candidatus Hydrogenedentes bacterium]|nr:DUF748 domain-containing protein [Candidatus Hydrogenedentota bacterium]